MLIGDQVSGFIDHGSQLLGVEMLHAAVRFMDAEYPRNALGDAVHQIDGGREHHRQRLEEPAGKKGETLGIQGGEGLGCDFRKHQHDKGQDQARSGNTGIAVEANTDDGGDGGGKNIDQVVADQNQADQLVGSLQKASHANRPMITFFGQVLQAVPVDGHHPGFRAGEERGEDQQSDERGKQYF